MYTVMIVDDEPLLRTAMVNAVEWEKLGFGRVVEASNGAQAQTLLKEYSPELVLTDIIMPEMNGVDLIRKIRDSGLDCKIIVLSGHDDYRFVREALLMGAQDYLLKSEVNSETLSHVITQVCATLTSEEPSKIHDEGIDPVERLLDINTSQGDKEQILRHMPREARNARCVAVMVSIDRFHELTSRDQRQQNALVQVVMDVFSQSCPGQNWYYRGDGLFLSVYMAQDESVLYDMTDESAFRRMYDMVERLCNASLSVGISSNGDDIRRLPELVIQAEDSAHMHFYLPERNVNRYSDSLRYKDGKALQRAVKQIINKISNSLNNSQPSALCEETISLWREISQKRYHPQQLRRACADLIGFTSNYLLADEIDASGFGWDQIYRGAKRCLTEAELLDYVSNCLKHLFHEYQQIIDRSIGSEHLHKAIQYIEKHYEQESLSLQIVAEMVSVNSSYLSRLFNQKIGRNYTQYLTHLRVKKASELLIHSRMSIEEVSARVGYKSAKYFCGVFKSVQGVSPSQYRRMFMSK